MKLPICSSIAKTLALGTLTASVMFAAKPAESAIFNVGGTNYNITTVTGSYDYFSSKITTTPWWGNSTLAINVATTIGRSFGYPNNNLVAPLVAHTRQLWFDGNSYVPLIFASYYDVWGRTEPSYILNTAEYLTWAVVDESPASASASAVPESLTILGSITAAGFGVAFKRKKNSSKK
jgi:hypothetical protein